MAIYESLDTHVMAALPPAQGVPVGSSIPIDLNPDWGNGPAGQERTAQMVGQTGGDLAIRIDVTTSFVAGSGAPLLQFHFAGTRSPAGSLIISNNFWTVLGSNVGPPSLGTGYGGFNASELQEGQSFYLRVNPWTTGQGRQYDGSPIEAQDIRYVGLVLSVPNFGTPFFSAGVVQGYFVNASDIAWEPKDFTYPSGTFIV